MSSTIQRDEAPAIVERILKRASTDVAFHALAISNSAAAVKEVSGKQLPEGFKVRFVSNEGADLTLVLPDVVTGDDELSDAELEQVAGGRCAASCAASCAVTSTVGIGIPGVGGAACV